jgi:hypothetical protein
MSTSQHNPPRVFDPADQEVASYRALSSLALAGFVAGLLSPAALLSLVLWFLPVVAVLLSGAALWRITARWPELVGRPAALAGLLLGTAFLVAAPVDDFVYRWLLRRQAREFAEIWIDSVRKAKKDHLEVYKAHHLLIDPRHRSPQPDELPKFYHDAEQFRRALKTFINEPVMRTLFALGTSAEIRFYETAEERLNDGGDLEQQTYAVTYRDEKNQPTTFFIKLVMQRTIDPSNGHAGWTLVRVDGGVRPPGW